MSVIYNALQNVDVADKTVIIGSGSESKAVEPASNRKKNGLLWGGVVAGMALLAGVFFAGQMTADVPPPLDTPVAEKTKVTGVSPPVEVVTTKLATPKIPVSKAAPIVAATTPTPVIGVESKTDLVVINSPKQKLSVITAPVKVVKGVLPANVRKPEPTKPPSLSKRIAPPKIVIAPSGATKAPALVKKAAREPVRQVRRSRALSSTKARVQVGRLSNEIRRSIVAKDDNAVLAGLARLEALTGVDSNYSIKMRAYWHLVKGENDASERYLAEMLTRNANDLGAGLNMAVLETRRGQLVEARRRLESLVLKYPDNRQLEQALKQLPQ